VSPDPQPDRVAQLVSVIVPSYCASAHIGATLSSVFHQTFREFEVIVVNDGSPDTPETERALAPYRSRIHYIVQANAGPGAARNAGILASRGELIAFLDADDRWHPEFLAEQVAFLRRTPACDLVYCDALISGNTPLAGRRFMESSPSDGPVTLETLLLQRCNVVLSGVVMRAEALFAVGLFDASLRRGQDFDLWIRLAHRGYRLEYQRKVLVERSERSSGCPEEVIADLERVLRVLEKTGRTLPLSSSGTQALNTRVQWATGRLMLEHAKRELALGNFDAARRHLSAADAKSLKARLALAALRVGPRLTRYIYLRRRAVLEARARTRPITSLVSGERLNLLEPDR
jgi:glycosyltransferase involved in cell wall biosynthesis